MRHLFTSCLLSIACFSCTFDDITPDGFRVGFARSDHDFDRLGVGPGSSQESGSTSPRDEFVNRDGGHTNTAYAELSWEFGAVRKKPDVDFDRMEQLLTRAAVEFARAMPQPAAPTINVGPTPPPVVVPDLGVTPEGQEEAEADVMGYLEWYAERSLIVQTIIAGLILAILGTLVLYRRALVRITRNLAFWRAKKAPPNGEAPKL